MNDAEFILLQIIKEMKKISGYDIKKIIDLRGYDQWADIKKSTIYNNLKKLDKKKLVVSFLDLKKKGKGAIPRRYSLTEEGEKEVKNKMIEYLSQTRERDKRFNIAISALQILNKKKIIDSLKKRVIFLKSENKRIKKEFKKYRPYLPLGAEALYLHILTTLLNDINFSQELIELVKHKKNIL